MLFRNLWMFLTKSTRPRITSVDQLIKHECRVLLNDIDENIHMNNTRFLSFAELGRNDWAFRTGLFKYALSKKMMTVVANSSIVYLKSLAPFAKFTLTTQIIHWTETMAYFEQKFIRNGKTHAIALIEIRLVMQKEKVPFSQIAKELGLELGEVKTTEPTVDFQKSLTRSLIKRANP